MSDHPERIAKLEYIVEHLTELLEKHMVKEEKERAELMSLFYDLSKQVAAQRNDMASKKAFVGGVIAAVSLVWMVGMAIVTIFSKWFHQ